jgi:hypothetical protein
MCMETPNNGALAAQIEGLRAMPIAQLNERYLQLFGSKPLVVYRQHLVRRIAWKLQAIAFGALSDAAMNRARAIASDVRFDDPQNLNPDPKPRSKRKQNRRQRDKRQPEPGSELTRIYRDRRIVVKVNASGFEYSGRQYSSLSAVARAATGTQWNGLVFFGVAKRGGTLKRFIKDAKRGARNAS